MKNVGVELWCVSHQLLQTCSGVVFDPPAAGDLKNDLRWDPPHIDGIHHTQDAPNPVSKPRPRNEQNVQNARPEAYGFRSWRSLYNLHLVHSMNPI